MNLLKPKSQEVETEMAVEGDIRELLRDETPRKPAPRPVVAVVNTNEPASNEINALLGRSAQGSLKEIDSLIATLQHVRGTLTSEGERLQRSIAKYVQSTQSTMESVKVIADSVGAWKPNPANQP